MVLFVVFLIMVLLGLSVLLCFVVWIIFSVVWFLMELLGLRNLVLLRILYLVIFDVVFRWRRGVFLIRLIIFLVFVIVYFKF